MYVLRVNTKEKMCFGSSIRWKDILIVAVCGGTEQRRE